MKSDLDKTIEKFENSRTSLEAYQAISDFVKIIETVPEFIEQVEKESENIQKAQIELNADKGWNYGLRGKELDEHNKRRARKHDALFQLDLMFPLRNLRNVRIGIQSENIINNSDWLFHRFSPDDSLPEEDKKEYQGFIDKLYKKILPFLRNEKQPAPTENAPTIKGVDFNPDKSILYIDDYEIKIARRDDLNKGHYILKHIFASPEGLEEEYPYKEIFEQTGTDEMKEFKAKSYQRACDDIQNKIREGTNFSVNDFLIFNSIRVKINQKYL